MKDKLIVANLKMNMIINDLTDYLPKINKFINNDNVVICPTSLYIPYFLKQKYKVGIQNIFYKSSGAYTGEISPKQAASMGIEYVLIGHSERRTYFNEIDSDINKKVYESSKYNLKIILCIGETLEQRNMLRTTKVLKKQINLALKNISNFDNIIIAYEPIWSIGTNIVPTNNDIEKTVSYIKQVVKELTNYSNIKVLYGGSVNETNIGNIININGVSGVLVGGASLDADRFLKMIEVAVQG